MADFKVLVRRIAQPVVDHPDAYRLTIVTIDGYQCIANKHEDGSWRYKEGDLVVYIPESAVIPEWLLKHLDMWDAASGKGGLAGSQGNRVKAIKLRGVVSQGILLPVDTDDFVNGIHTIPMPEGNTRVVEDGDDVAELLGITKYEPPVPSHMTGEVCNIHGHTVGYDIENIQSCPGMFKDGELVVATEKLHGTFCQISFLGVEHTDLFGGNHNIYVSSKGLGAKGLVFKNSESNDNNLYVRNLNKLLSTGLEDRVYSLFDEKDELRILGEIFGPGVQDLHYGLKAPEFRVFDIMVNGDYLSGSDLTDRINSLGLVAVPELYTGPYDKDVLTGIRDGKDTIAGAHMREGVVIKASPESMHLRYGRKIAKFVSPDYLLRRGKNATEFT